MCGSPIYALATRSSTRSARNDRAELDFSSIYTTSFRDPIFNDTYQREWIDHILYSRIEPRALGQRGAVHRILPSGPIWVKYKHASDYFPISAELTL